MRPSVSSRFRQGRESKISRSRDTQGAKLAVNRDFHQRAAKPTMNLLRFAYDKLLDVLEPPAEPTISPHETICRIPTELLAHICRVKLAEQCRLLDIPLEELVLERLYDVEQPASAKFSAELAAFTYFERQGYRGSYREGHAILNLMRCACLEFLREHTPFGDPIDASRHYFEAQCTNLQMQSKDIVSEIASATSQSISRNLTSFLAFNDETGSYPAMDHASLLALWEALGAKKMAEIASIFVQDPYAFRAGWPDLTLTRDGKLLFVEIKTTDKLHTSQVRTIYEMVKPANLDVRVVRVKYSRTSR